MEIAKSILNSSFQDAVQNLIFSKQASFRLISIYSSISFGIFTLLFSKDAILDFKEINDTFKYFSIYEILIILNLIISSAFLFSILSHQNAIAKFRCRIGYAYYLSFKNIPNNTDNEFKQLLKCYFEYMELTNIVKSIISGKVFLKKRLHIEQKI